MHLFAFCLALIALPVFAADPALRPSAHLLFKQPDLLKADQCVEYREGGNGWVLTDPVFYLKGRVLSTRIEPRHLGLCPVVPGKNMNQYSREEFIRHAEAFPCVAEGVPERDEQIGVVRLKVDRWETPYAVREANSGRLYRGMFLNKPLVEGMEIELEADLLSVCNK